MPPPAPLLPDELLEEIFLRLPPDEPASLVRASLASKPWLGLLTGPRFCGRYREFHGAPPMLGFLYSCQRNSEEDTLSPFVSTTNFAPRFPDHVDRVDAIPDYSASDCRHGRVLLCDKDMVPTLFVVWDPMTGCRSELRAPVDYPSQLEAVLCAVSGCDHRACHKGPFRVVLVGLEDSNDDGCVAYAHVSLPEVGKWSEPCSSLDLAERLCIVDKPPVFVQDALYFMLVHDEDDGDDNVHEDDDADNVDEDDDADSIFILKYDLGSNCMSLIDAPPQETDPPSDILLMAMGDGGLGFAHLNELNLNLWSRQMGFNGVATWTRCIVVNLKELFPIQKLKQTLIRLIGSIEGSDIIFVTMELGIYKINLKSQQWKKIWKLEKFHTLVPYMSFYNPPERGMIPCNAGH